MSASYKPPVISFAIQNVNSSFGFFHDAEECVLSVPGPTLAEETLQCGILSARSGDKISKLNLRLADSASIRVPRLRDSTASMEMKIVKKVLCGDHITIFGQITRFIKNSELDEPNLVSMGPDTQGYKLLKKRGIHRIGIIAP
jgi:flavin reductase (DIM6/NTAB) family NADH-FMN oxidoreductase RutF